MNADRKSRKGSRTLFLPVLGAAALLALLLLVLRPGGNGDPSTRIPLSPVGPTDGPVERLLWRRPAGAARFTVELFGPGGERLWSAAVRDTTAPLPEGLTLSPDVIYRWRVTTHFAEGLSQAAPDETFRIRAGRRR